MAFQTGTINNSHQLIHKLCGFLRSAGWDQVATLKSEGPWDPDGYDVVFHSFGENGLQDVYIRIAAGLCDKTTVGDIQFPFDDGYTEYINGLAYQYFPVGGTSENDGFNQIGRYGPVLYEGQTADAVDPGSYDEYNLFTFTGLQGDKLRRRKIYDASGTSTPPKHIPSGFDGKYFLYDYHYFDAGSAGYLYRVNLFDDTFTLILYLLGADGAPYTNLGHTGGAGYVKLNNGKEYMYYVQAQTVTDKTNHLGRFDIQTNAFKKNFSNACPCTLSSYAPRASVGPVVGTKRKRNGHRLLYFMPGNLSGSISAGSTEWTYIDAETGKWHESLISPALPWSVGKYDALGFYHSGYATYATKEATGYSEDRLYLIRGAQTTDFASIAINNDGYVSGSWVSHAALPYAQNLSSGRLFVSGASLFLHNSSETSDTIRGNILYRWQFPTDPTASGTWELVSKDGVYNFMSSLSAGAASSVHDHLCNRAKVTEFSTNTYWAFADKDHLVVVVKDSSGKYTYIYSGLFDTYSDKRIASTISVSLAGSNAIEVDKPEMFKIGQLYTIVETTGLYGETVTGLNKETRKFLPSEAFTVTGIHGQSIMTSALANSYGIGSKVGEDPLPLMVRVHGMEKAQTVNNINLIDPSSSKDPPFQTYKLMPSVGTSVTQAVDIEDRSLGTFVVGILLVQSGNTGLVGKEIRGQLKNVYACGTALANEAEVAIGPETYIVFDIDASGETRRIVVGPK